MTHFDTPTVLQVVATVVYVSVCVLKQALVTAECTLTEMTCFNPPLFLMCHPPSLPA